MAVDFKSKLKLVPHKPGVYIFKDAAGAVLYVGKALDLRNRLGQYFQRDGNGDGRYQIPFMLRQATDFDHIITDNEVECLMLENNLIKKYRPRYNIKLRDDKNYVFIKVDYAEEIPQIYTVRNPDSANARYFGPYSSAVKVRETLSLIRKIFPYCSNRKVSSRPCFYYFLHRCPGVCVGKVSPQEYRETTIRNINLFLAGNISQVRAYLQARMKTAAADKQFELAAGLRDQLRSIEVIEERQKAIFAQKANWDFISLFQSADKTSANVFAIRQGRLNDRKNFILENTGGKTVPQILAAFMETYYLQATELPRQIYVPQLPDDNQFISKLFSAKKIQICKPQKGRKAEMLELGIENAKSFFENWAASQSSELSRTGLALDELQVVLKLPKPPRRIECFDISNIQGTNSVASMVVFEDGRPKKSEYRKFKIKIDGTPNDFAMMAEALDRRFSPKNLQAWAIPDLLVIDGGKGQLAEAVQVLNNYALQIPVISLAKREEEIFVPQSSSPILLEKSNYALQMLQRLRDEAHRFAITFHRSLRSKKAYKSALDEIAGIGPKKKKLLIKKFGSVNAIKTATKEELAATIGEKLAEKLSKEL